MQKLLEIENLGKHYKDFALEGISISLEPGNVIGLIGSNGAGKTTIMKAALGLIAADEGTVSLLGERVFPGNSACAHIKQRVGVVFDVCAFPADSRVTDVGSIGKAAFPTWRREKWDSLTERFGLAPKKKLDKLSRGMSMKLSLAFALAHDPQLLLLDEATAGLDPLARDEALDLLREFMSCENHGILMSTHITTDLEKIADEIICLDKGKQVFSTTRDAIADEAGIARCRLAELDAIRASSMFASNDLRYLRGAYGADVLVPNRIAFARAFPDIAVDRATIEEYMTLHLKGESL